MPRTRIEIAELFILHLVQLDVKLDILVIEIAMIDCHVVTRPMAHGSPVDLHLAEREQLAGILDVSKILHLECDVMHLGLRTAEEIYSVMVRIAAQENKIIFDPVGYSEA